jgi:sterol desaturase/sphingolipid hydroxylase (fatty acid hydroxylase superfamily)
MTTSFLAPPDPQTRWSAIPPLPAPSRPRRGVARFVAPVALVTAVGLTVGLVIDRVGFVLLAVLFLLVVPFEKLFPRHRQRLRRDGLGTDVAFALTTVPLGAAAVFVSAFIAIASLAWLPGLALRPLVAMLPALPQMLVGIVLFDVAIYWAHRFAHEVPFMWRFHSIHHSTRHLDWVSGFRNHPLDGVFFAPAFILLIAAGFSAEFSGVLALVQFLTGLFAHANVRWRLRPLHKIVLTPEFHHWHHTNEPDAINTNYSVFLPAWDILFGTFFMPADRRPQVYGVSEPIPRGLARQLWHPFRGLRSPWSVIRHPWRATAETWTAVRRGVGQMHRSARRTSRRVRRSYTS